MRFLESESDLEQQSLLFSKKSVHGVDFRPSLKNAGRVLREDRMRALFIQGQQVNFAVFINIKESSLSKRSLYR